MNETIEPSRREMTTTVLDQGFHWRIMFLSGGASGDGDRPEPLARALRNLGHHVLEVDLERHGLVDHEDDSSAKTGATRIRLDRCAGMVDAFSPQVIITCGRPLGFDAADAAALKSAGRVLLGIGLAEPDDVPAAAGLLRTHDVYASPVHGAVDQYRRGGIENVIHVPLTETRPHEHRWMDLFSALRMDDGGQFPWLGARRLAEVRRVLAPTLPRAKKVIVSGYYGAGNLGDEMILSSIVEALRRADPAIQVTVAAEDRLSVERTHGLQAYSRPDHATSLEQVRTAAAVVLGGGGLWHDYSFARSGALMSFFSGARSSIAGYGIMPLMAHILGRPFHVVGMGVGPLTTAEARQAVRFVAEQADSIYVREEASAELLASLPVPEERLHTGPDIVYGTGLPDPPELGVLPRAMVDAAEAGYVMVGLNLRTWAAVDMDALVTAVTRALTQYAEGHRIAVVSIPMQAGEDRDQDMIRRVLEALPSTVPRLEFGHRPSVIELCAIYAELDVLLSMRLHSALIAHRQGLPVVGFGYDPKVVRHFREVGRSGFCLPLDASSTRIRDAVSAALAEGFPARSRQAVTSLEADARRSLAVAAEQIAATPTPMVVHEPPSRPASRSVARPGRTAGRATSGITSRAEAAFSRMTWSAVGVDPSSAQHAGRHGATPAELRLSLETRRPRQGMSVEWSGVIGVTGKGTREIDLALHNHWSNARARGRVFVEVEIGGSLWREDLSLHAGRRLLRLRVAGGTALPFTLRLVVRRKGFRASSWGSATACRLVLGEVTAAEGSSAPVLFASSGQIHPSEGARSGGD